MTGATLKRKLVMLYGKDFHAAVAEELSVDKSTIYRWVAAASVPGIVASWVSVKVAAHERAQVAAE